MKKILVIKASSRLGMKYFPHGSNVLNIGVEEGPEAVVDTVFLTDIERKGCKATVVPFVFSKPENTTDENYYQIVANESDALAHIIEEQIVNGGYSGIVTVGGDHGVGYATVLGILRGHKNKRVGVIDFDSHGDIHLKNTSPSGNFHGMWVRPFFGLFDDPSISARTDVQMESSQFLYIGNMLLEDEEQRFIGEKKISVIDSNELTATQDAALNKITLFCNSVDVVHVTFDIDVYKKDIVSATGTPNPDGFDSSLIDMCIKRIVDSGKLFSLDVVEVNPKKDNAESTISTAQFVIESYIPGFKDMPTA
jgi:arginase